MPEVNPLTSRLTGLSGVFELRGVPIPIVHLSKFLGDENSELSENQKVIVAEFGVKRAGFVVDSTHKIRRIKWDQVLTPASDSSSYITAMTLVEQNDFLFILDFEKIIADIESESSLKDRRRVEQPSSQRDSRPGDQERLDPMNSRNPTFIDGLKHTDSMLHSITTQSILLVDDSTIILKNTTITLQRLGLHVITARNGQEALTILESSLTKTKVSEKISLVITDIEMPQMDGFMLTKKIRELPGLSNIPIIIHSSLSGKATQETGSALGANMYVIKNDIKKLVTAIGDLTGWIPNQQIGA
jgi:two-component system chemotaxis response regulator CheV